MYRRRPAVAGAFYTGNAAALRKEIQVYLSKAEKKTIDGDIIGLICPHAGYVYSGPVAACSYQYLAGSGIELAVVLAPSHRARFNGASIIPEGTYETPLGDAEIDGAVGAKLMERPGFSFIREVHEGEHSLEVQVPFLQVVAENAALVPIVIGTVDIDACRRLAWELARALEGEKRRFAVIISTDLSHYHSYESAVALDRRFAQAVETFDEEKVRDVIDAGMAEACGEGPVLTGLVLCKKLGARGVEILKYANSGDTAGGKGQVVGYLSAAIVR